jgi:hypothetical protein
MKACGAGSHRMAMLRVAQRDAFRRIVFMTMLKEARMAIDIRDAHARERLPVPTASQQALDNLAHRLHPAIYFAIVALAAVFVASAASFAAGNDSYNVIAIAYVFIWLAMFLPFQLWRVRRHGHDPRDTSLSHRTLRGWLSAEFDVWKYRVKGMDAAVAILLPIAAVTIGILFLAIVLHIDVG